MNEKKNNWNSHCKYTIRGCKQYLPYAIAVFVAAIIFFVLLMSCFFCKYEPYINETEDYQRMNWKKTAETLIVNTPS